jgi:hypothetical protein
MAEVLVVYESMFGDAQQVALAVAQGLADAGSIDCLEVGGAPTSVPAGVRLLVVGSPNHAFGLPSERTRDEAKAQADRPLVSTGIGVREWLERLDPPSQPTCSATFDTRMAHPKALTRLDHASRTAARRLRALGFTPLGESAHFTVADVRGPLVDGELDRAAQWGRQLAARLAAT